MSIPWSCSISSGPELPDPGARNLYDAWSKSVITRWSPSPATTSNSSNGVHNIDPNTGKAKRRLLKGSPS